MCLVALALGQSPRFPLVLASNRDEFFDRPSAALDWWQSPEGGLVLAGRDLQAGGTWLGLSAAGRLGFVTNVRTPAAQRPQAPSRGELVPRWLRGDSGFDDYWRAAAAASHNGFNLVVADAARGGWFSASNAGDAVPRRLGEGLYAVSNAALDAPWPKTERLKERLRAALAATAAQEPAKALAARLFDALADRRMAPDAELPSTGISLDWERWLSAAFIRTPDGRYGTRCSTVVIGECMRGRRIAHVFERSFDDGASTLLRYACLPDWPPAPGAAALPPAPVVVETLAAQNV